MCHIDDRTNASWSWDGAVFSRDVSFILGGLSGKRWGADTVLRCDDCDLLSPAAAWSRGFVGCETCGDHSAIMCPWCGWGHDGISIWPTVEEES